MVKGDEGGGDVVVVEMVEGSGGIWRILRKSIALILRGEQTR